MRWHCYTEYQESVYSCDVEADSAEEAAVFAAESENAEGEWTIVPLKPGAAASVVRIEARTIYRVEGA